MITETGRVVAVEADCLWVETIQRSACQSCSAKRGCGQNLAAEWGGKTNLIRVMLGDKRAEDYREDQLVSIGIAEDLVVKGSLLAYMTPLLGLLAGVFLASLFALPEWAVIVISSLGFLAGGCFVRWHSYAHRSDPRVQPILMDSDQPLQWSAAPSQLNTAHQ